jgi:hypothetical protein
VGKLLTGHYGEPPEAESTVISLNDCRQRLSLKPSDFVSGGAPDFFRKSYGTKGRYLLFLIDEKEAQGNAVWKAGYYLLPMEAAEVLRVFRRNQNQTAATTGGRVLRVDIECKETPPEPIMERAKKFARDSQPLFFTCKCDHLEMKLSPPWGFRREWKAKLACPDRCQPVLNTAF